MTEKLVFLPGASGDRNLWKPLGTRLQHPGVRCYMGWPGFGGLPRQPDVNGIDDLVSLVVREMDDSVELFAQSMGGVVAVLATLQNPKQVKHLVLTVTSGGIDTSALGAVDWRQEHRATDPHAPDWFEKDHSELTDRLREISCPVLLLWGDTDPISPVAVGRRLAELFPNAELAIIPGGKHNLASECVDHILPYVDRHLKKPVNV